MMTVHLVVLNYNGRRLLAECLPSLLHAARRSRHRCEVVVIDNGSTDDSVEYLRVVFPRVRLFEQPNRGLCSYNEVLPRLPGRVAVLLNNDVKLAEDAIDPLVEPFLTDDEGSAATCFMAAPLCRRFDGQGHEGLQAAVRWRWGLVEATAYFPGYERTRLLPGLTAAAGPVMAVDRERFLQLGGFDPLYLPGRLEDFDFAFRGYLAGYQGRYLPASVAYHKGQASFDATYGSAACDVLALRNTLLFQWKNLRRPRHIARHLAALPARLAFDWLRAPRAARETRFAFTRAFFAALLRLGACRRTPCPPRRSRQAERDFFEQFAADRMAERTIESNSRLPAAPPSASHCEAADRDELLAAAGGAHA
jgi:GT2 family glycosyltransferase